MIQDVRRLGLSNNELALVDTKRLVILLEIVEGRDEPLRKTLRDLQKTVTMRTMSPHPAGSLGLEDMVNRDAVSQDHIMTQDPDAVGMMTLLMKTGDQVLREGEKSRRSPPRQKKREILRLHHPHRGELTQPMSCLPNRHKDKGNQLTVRVRVHRHFHHH